jgi:hypothetical protein
MIFAPQQQGKPRRMEESDRSRASTLNLDTLLDALRATAQEGLFYAENPYDRERYRKLFDLACAHYAARAASTPARSASNF